MRKPEAEREIEKLEDVEMADGPTCQVVGGKGQSTRCHKPASWRRSVLAQNWRGTKWVKTHLVCDDHAQRFATRKTYDGDLIPIDVYISGSLVPNPWIPPPNV